MPWLLASAITIASCASTAHPPAPTAAPLPEGTSVTVYPVLLAGQPNRDAALVLGILLERGGITEVEVADSAFVLPAGADFGSITRAFAAHVANQELGTGCALLAAFDGVPGRSVDAVAGSLVRANGTVAWTERLAAGNAEFDRARPGEPMECLELLAERLREPLHLHTPNADAKPTKLEKRMAAAAGVPEQAELDSMAQRLASLRQKGKPALRIAAPRIGASWSAEAATKLAQALRDQGFHEVALADAPLSFSAKPSSNEQTMLWSAARSLQQLIRAAPPHKEHWLCADFLQAAPQQFGAVHTFLLSPEGDWVVVDYQNSHHDDFQQVAPKSLDDCALLAARRLAAAFR
jgi:hypothetical protein